MYGVEIKTALPDGSVHYSQTALSEEGLGGVEVSELISMHARRKGSISCFHSAKEPASSPFSSEVGACFVISSDPEFSKEAKMIVSSATVKKLNMDLFQSEDAPINMKVSDLYQFIPEKSFADFSVFSEGKEVSFRLAIGRKAIELKTRVDNRIEDEANIKEYRPSNPSRKSI